MQKYGWIQKDWSLKDELQTPIMEEVTLHVLENIRDGVLLFNEKGEVLHYNAAANKLLQIDTTDSVILTTEDILHQKDQQRFHRQIAALCQSKKLTDQFTFVTGENESVDCACNLFLLSEKSIVLLILTITVNEDSILPVVPHIYKKIFEQTINGLMISDLKGRIIDINEKGCEFFDQQKKDLIGKDSLKEFQRMETFIPEYNQYMQKMSSSSSEVVSTLMGKRGDCQYEFMMIPHISKNINLTIIRDVTDIVQMMEHLNKYDTLKVIGQLAAGIAHEIRNPMTSLKGFIQLLQASVKEDHSMYFGVILSELQRIETIMTEFLMLAKPKTVVFDLVSLPSIIRETIELMQPQASLGNIQMNTVDEGSSGLVYGESNRLKQVFINIIKNSIEAMQDGGEIIFTVSEQDGIQHIAIQDTGCGIEQKQLDRLNEPFYTTKENGTGLGLVVTFKIIEEHQGKVEVESKVGEGTCFHLYFPVRGADDIDETTGKESDWTSFINDK
ncbi:histidine kinase [Jeotgalibacillus soli]|uniref:histidine kinase n=1 Tax=Jeotgalibacillus soli TaxID=889306 RepID=A0A0C2VA65_9BACL|nr:histidine kinase [Jeotgalibacillus soli]